MDEAAKVVMEWLERMEALYQAREDRDAVNWIRQERERGQAIIKALGERDRLIEQQAAELARLRPYAEPKLFAAASDVLEVAGKGSDEEVDLALVMLTEAVAWWDGLAGEGEVSNAAS